MTLRPRGRESTGPPVDVKTLKRYEIDMSDAVRATVYFNTDLHRALRLKAAETERSISDLVNDAVRAQLLEDAEDLEALRKRRKEPTLSFEELVKDMKRQGKL